MKHLFGFVVVAVIFYVVGTKYPGLLSKIPGMSN